MYFCLIIKISKNVIVGIYLLAFYILDHGIPGRHDGYEIGQNLTLFFTLVFFFCSYNTHTVHASCSRALLQIYTVSFLFTYYAIEIFYALVDEITFLMEKYARKIVGK